jgi:hypothetical protein
MNGWKIPALRFCYPYFQSCMALSSALGVQADESENQIRGGFVLVPRFYEPSTIYSIN